MFRAAVVTFVIQPQYIPTVSDLWPQDCAIVAIPRDFGIVRLMGYEVVFKAGP